MRMTFVLVGGCCLCLLILRPFDLLTVIVLLILLCGFLPLITHLSPFTVWRRWRTRNFQRIVREEQNSWHTDLVRVRWQSIQLGYWLRETTPDQEKARVTFYQKRGLQVPALWLPPHHQPFVERLGDLLVDLEALSKDEVSQYAHLNDIAHQLNMMEREFRGFQGDWQNAVHFFLQTREAIQMLLFSYPSLALCQDYHLLVASVNIAFDASEERTTTPLEMRKLTIALSGQRAAFEQACRKEVESFTQGDASSPHAHQEEASNISDEQTVS